MSDLRTQLGKIDIYWFDQILRGLVTPDMRILDVGCGGGRNLVYLLREGYDVTAVDREPARVEATGALATELGRPFPAAKLRRADIKALPFADDAFDVVSCCAVLHFAEDDAGFDAMVKELGRVLAPGGLLFTRLASSIGLEDRVELLSSGLHRLPDGSIRYLVDEARLIAATESLGGTLADPIKTTNVQNQRCMTTWCVRKA